MLYSINLVSLDRYLTLVEITRHKICRISNYNRNVAEQTMREKSSQTIADQLLADLKQERQLIDLMIRGCIELRWAIAEEEKEIARAMIYNAFETYAFSRGMSLEAAERFCDQHLDALIQRIWATL